MIKNVEQELRDEMGSLFAMAVRLTGDRAAADDLMQDTIIRILASRNSYEPGTNFLGWAYRIMRNRQISLWRRRRHPTVNLDHPAAQAIHARVDVDTGLVREEVKAALRQLPFVQREAIVLVAVKEMSYPEVAALTGCSVGTIKSRVSRGRAMLRRMLLEEPRQAADAPAPPALESRAWIG